MTFINCRDFERVSGLEDFEDERAAVTSLPGRIDDRSYVIAESRSDVTGDQYTIAKSKSRLTFKSDLW
jgi:hypothetical protein